VRVAAISTLLSPMGSLMLLSWGIDESSEVGSLEELDRQLDKIAEETVGKGRLVQASGSHRRTLVVGVGLDESVMIYFDEYGCSFVGVGDRTREDYLDFEFAGELSELMGAQAVPQAVARAASRQFFLNGERPDVVEWEREWT
jgi:hypothetical protein